MKIGKINFKGYNNVLCTHDIPVAGGNRVSLLSMRLNDEDGHKDLTELRKILEMQGYPAGNEYENTLTLTYVDNPAKQSANLYFNTRVMYWGDELRLIEEKYIPRVMTQEKYQLERDIHMKAYTLIANLTSRMINDKFDGEDKDVAFVIKNMFITLESILQDSKSAFHVTNTACLKQFKFQHLAKAINKGVCKTMERFFR